MMKSVSLQSILSLTLTLALTGCFGFDRDSAGSPDATPADAGQATQVEILAGEIQTIRQGQAPTYSVRVKDKYNTPVSYGQVKVSSPQDPSFEVLIDTDNLGEKLTTALTSLNATGRVELVFAPVSSHSSATSKTVELIILTQPTTLTASAGSTVVVASNVVISGNVKDSNGFNLPNQTIDLVALTGTFTNLPATTTTDANGNYSVSIDLGTISGSYGVEIKSGTASQNRSFTALPGDLANVDILSGNNQSLTAGQAGVKLKAKLTDAYSNVKANEVVSLWSQNLLSDSNGEVEFTLTNPNIAGIYTEDLIAGSISVPVSYEVSAGAPAHITLISGSNQVKARGQSFDPIVVEVEDAYGNKNKSLAVEYNDGTSSSVNTNSNGRASKTYSFSSVGTKNITITAGAVSVSTSLEVKDYSPTALTISSTDLLEWSDITTITLSASSSLVLGSGFTASATAANSAYTYSSTAPETIVDAVPVLSSSNKTPVDITNGGDTLTVSSNITLPSGVSTASCEVYTPSFLTSVSCSFSTALTFLRNQLDLGSLSIKGLSDGFGSLDYKISNSLEARKIKVKAWTRPNQCSAGDEKARFLFMTGSGLLFRDCANSALSWFLNPNTSALNNGNFAFYSTGTNISSFFFDNDNLFFQQGAGASGGVIVLSPALVGKRQTFSISTNKEEPYIRDGVIYGFDGTNSKCAVATNGTCPFNSFKGIYLFESGGEDYFWERDGIYAQTGTTRDMVFPIFSAFTSYVLDTGSTPFKASITGVAGGANVVEYDLGLFDSTAAVQTVVVQFRNHSGGSLTFSSTLSSPDGSWTQQSNTCLGGSISNNGTCFHRVRIQPSVLTPGVYVAHLNTSRGNSIKLTAKISAEALSPYPQKVVVDSSTKEAFFTFSSFFFHMDATNGFMNKYPLSLGENFSASKFNKVFDLETEVWVNRYDTVADEFILLSYDKTTHEFTEYANLKNVDFVVKYNDHFYFSAKDLIGKYKDGVFTKIFNEQGVGNGQVKNNKLYIPTLKSVLEVCDPDITTCN